MNRGVITLAAVLAVGACKRPRPTAVDDDEDDAGVALAPADANVGPRPWCGAVTERVVRDGALDASTAGTAGTVRSVSLLPMENERWLVSIVDSFAGAVSVQSGVDPVVTLPLGAGETSDVSVAVGASGPFVGWVRDPSRGREHVVHWGPRLSRHCVSSEVRDEGLSLTVSATSSGALVFWDDDGPSPAAGSVKAQRIDSSAAQAATSPAVAGCGPAVQLSPPEQDASDPVSVSLPDGGAVVSWLTSRDVSTLENNDTSTDVWALSVDLRGAPRGRAVRVTSGEGHRFGLAAWADARFVWLAFRDAAPSDNEARGDGGRVVALRLAHGTQGLGAPTPVRTLTLDGANPTGAPRVTAALGRGSAVEVWWAERHGATVETFHRGLTPGAQLDPTSVAVREPTLTGALPVAVRPNGEVTWIARRGARVSIATSRCVP